MVFSVTQTRCERPTPCTTGLKARCALPMPELPDATTETRMAAAQEARNPMPGYGCRVDVYPAGILAPMTRTNGVAALVKACVNGPTKLPADTRGHLMPIFLHTPRLDCAIRGAIPGAAFPMELLLHTPKGHLDLGPSWELRESLTHASHAWRLRGHLHRIQSAQHLRSLSGDSRPDCSIWSITGIDLARFHRTANASPARQSDPFQHESGRAHR